MTQLHEFFERQRSRNLLHSALLLGGMFLLFSAFGWMLGGGLGGIVLLGILGLITASVGARVSPRMVLRLYRARRLDPASASGLFRMIEELSTRAGLASPPEPHYIPSEMVNAFAVGTRSRAAIGITDGMLRSLEPREIRGVLAHEITHLRNNDAWVMSLADWVTRMVNLFSWFGQILLLITLPAILLGAGPPLPLLLLLMMIFAPTATALMQLALSRAREYDADLGAARLTGDPRGLASALQKLDRIQGGFLERIFLPGRRVPEPSLLRTHPPTGERVRRLLEMERKIAGESRSAPELPVLDRLPSPPRRTPRWHTLGTWH